MIYAGIGSRNAPVDVLNLMKATAMLLAEEGYILRSGGADGADTAFEEGCDRVGGKKEIFLPWKNFNGHESELYEVSNLALEFAEETYETAFPNTWQYLKRPTKLFMGRNMYQVLGYTLDVPVDFVVCWTPDGCTSRSTRKRKTGGTGQAIAFASELQIPVFNLQQKFGHDDLMNFLENQEP